MAIATATARMPKQDEPGAQIMTGSELRQNGVRLAGEFSPPTNGDHIVFKGNVPPDRGVYGWVFNDDGPTSERQSRAEHTCRCGSLRRSRATGAA